MTPDGGITGGCRRPVQGVRGTAYGSPRDTTYSKVVWVRDGYPKPSPQTWRVHR